VGEQKLGLSNNRPRNTNELLLPAGKLTRIQILFANDLETVERVSHERSALTLAVAAIGERDIEVLVNREVVEQMILLEHEADLLVPQRGAFLRLQMMNRGFAQKIFTAPAVVVHSENVQQRGFACARRPHDRDKVAFLNVQIDLAQDVKKLLLRQRIAAFQISKLDHCKIRNFVHSTRRASIGSTRLARRAGRKQAINATT